MSDTDKLLERLGCKIDYSYGGCSVGKGWHMLIEQLVRDLFAVGWDGDVHQAKEKFGRLRFYVGETSKKMRGLIEKAEISTDTICEECGETGNEVRWRRAVRILCASCFEARKVESP